MRLAGIYWRFKRDPARLTEILVALGSQAPSAQEFPTTATEALVQVTAWGEKLRELPGFMDMGGTYIRPHCMGKRLIAIASRLPPRTSWATVGLEKLTLEKDRHGKRRIARIYRFEFTVTGGERYPGHTYVQGGLVQRVELPPHRFTPDPEQLH